MKRLFVGLLLTGAVGVGVRAYYVNQSSNPPSVATARVTQGSLVNTVTATGTLGAVTTVQVGTQVSGTVSWLGADFNSIVKKGQVIARLDPSLINAQIEQARATLGRSTAEVENARVQVTDAEQKLGRAEMLSTRSLIAQSDLDATRVAVDSAKAQLRAAEAQLLQARASLNQNEVNLRHTMISAPIDGIVIERAVDVGQTVAASLSSPTIFSIADDLTKMQVQANIDESDIGGIQPNQAVRFTVDAYPNEEFHGTTRQVRLHPTVVQNVTTYAVIIDVPNPDLKLKPGMTATVNVETARRDDVVKVPNAALRFRPTADAISALKLNVPPGRDGNRGETTSKGQLAGDDSGRGRVWVKQGDVVNGVAVRIGITDGQSTELLSGDLQPGAEVITSVSTGSEQTRARSGAGSVFMGGPPAGGFGQRYPGGAQGARSSGGAPAGAPR